MSANNASAKLYAYDLSALISDAHAVASAMMDSIPGGPCSQPDLNRVAGLGSALERLLKEAEIAADKLEHLVTG